MSVALLSLGLVPIGLIFTAATYKPRRCMFESMDERTQRFARSVQREHQRIRQRTKLLQITTRSKT